MKFSVFTQYSTHILLHFVYKKNKSWKYEKIGYLVDGDRKKAHFKKHIGKKRTGKKRTGKKRTRKEVHMEKSALG